MLMADNRINEASVAYAIQQMKRPLKGVPFPTVIEAICGKKVLPFDERDPADRQLLADMKRAAADACTDINVSGIRRARANEVGNDIEGFVRKALGRVGYHASSPETATGRRQAVG